jgi:hypothetical protein
MRTDFAACLLSSLTGRRSKPRLPSLLPRVKDAGPSRALSTRRSVIAGSRGLKRAGVESLAPICPTGNRGAAKIHHRAHGTNCNRRLYMADRQPIELEQVKLWVP